MTAGQVNKEACIRITAVKIGYCVGVVYHQSQPKQYQTNTVGLCEYSPNYHTV